MKMLCVKFEKDSALNPDYNKPYRFYIKGENAANCMEELSNCRWWNDLARFTPIDIESVYDDPHIGPAKCVRV